MSLKRSILAIIIVLALNSIFDVVGGSAQIRIKVDSSSLDFGGVALIATKDLSFKITDTTDVAIQIDKIVPASGSTADFKVLSPQNFPIVLLPNTTPQSIIVEFSPKLLGVRKSDLQLQTSDGTLTIPMQGTGTGEESSLDLSLNAIDFGIIGPGTSIDTIVYLHSRGPDSATVTGLQVTNGGGQIYFDATIVDAKLKFPFKVAAGDSVAIDVRFYGILPEETKSGSVVVFGNSSNPPSCLLSGSVKWGSYALSVAKLDFGQLYEGEVKDSFVTIQNTGSGTISIDVIQSVSDDFSLPNPPAMPLLIRAGQSYDLPIRANPLMTDAHTWSLQMNSSTSIPNLRFAQLIDEVLPMPLTAPKHQTVQYFCSNPKAATITIPVTNTGARMFTLGGIASADPSVVLTPSVTLPLKIQPGQTLNFTIGFDASLVKNNDLVVRFLGGVRILMADTVRLTGVPVLITAGVKDVSTSLDVTSASVELISGTDFSALGLHELSVTLRLSDPNVASIDTSTIKLDPALAGATFTIVTDASGAIVVKILSPSVITVPAGGKLLSYSAKRYVSGNLSTHATVTLLAPEFDQCIGFTDDSTEILALNTCGSKTLTDYMMGRPISFNAVLLQNPVANDVLSVEGHSPSPGTMDYVIKDILGRPLLSGSFLLSAGMSRLDIPLASLHQNTYYLGLTGPDGTRKLIRFVKN